MLAFLRNLRGMVVKIATILRHIEVRDTGSEIVLVVKKDLKVQIEGDYFQNVEKNTVLKTGRLIYLNPKFEETPRTVSDSIKMSERDAARGLQELRNRTVNNSCGITPEDKKGL